MAVDSLLLQSKLVVPPTRSDLVPRPRLLERLDAALETRLTLVSGPAGSGKSTLLSQWAEQQPAPIAWLSLDERDNDLARYLSYLFAAIHGIVADLTCGAQDTLPQQSDRDRSEPFPAWAESALHALLNALTKLPRSIVLVLDDYHKIRHPDVHAATALLLEHSLGQLRLIILTRSDPPFSIAQLRGRGEAIELRQRDLQFNKEECAQFLCHCMGLDLTQEQIAMLAERTEGWIAGLQMTAASLRQRADQDVSDFIADFVGSNRFIFDYLLEEVLNQQPVPIQQFLLKTCVLDQLSGALCDHVMSTSSQGIEPGLRGQHILEQLERSNLFLVPLDDSRHEYRYHHLFSALLRQRLQVLHPELEPELHRRASAWYQEHGLVDQAMQHALAAGQDQLAAQIADKAAEETLRQGRITQFLSWLDALPPLTLDKHPRLHAHQVGLRLFTGQALEVVESGLQAITDAHDTREVVGEVAVFRALIAAYRGDQARSKALARTARDHLPPQSGFLRGLVAGLLGVCELVRGETNEARDMFQEALAVGQASGNAMLSTLALCHQGDLAVLSGRLHEACGFYEQSLASATDRQGHRLPVAGLALIGLGHVHLERLELEQAKHAVTEGLELAAGWGMVAGLMGLIQLSMIHQLQANSDEASTCMRRARRLATRFDVMQADDVIVDACQARLWLLQGNVKAASRWARSLGGHTTARLAVDIDGDALTCQEAFQYLTVAQVLAAEERHVEALSLSALLRPLVEEKGWMSFAIELLVLEAQAHHALSRPGRAQEALKHVLRLTELEGHARVYVAGRAFMAELLRHMQRLGVSPDQVARLETACRAQHQVVSTAEHATGEGLSQREVEVLQLIDQGLTNQQIADRLVIALSTVKSHVNHIYRKLDVARRTEALLRARSLSLI